MKIKENLGSRIFDVFNYIFMIFIIIIMLYPFWNVFVVSISGNGEVLRNEVNLIPKNINFAMYQLILSLKEVQTGYLNTVLYSVVGTILTLLMTSLYAYPLSRPYFPGKKFFNIFLAITMFVSGGMIPTFMLITKLGGIDSFWVMVVPGCLGAWNVFMMRTYYTTSIPQSLTEAAMIDGASEFKILFSIILPLSRPILATLGLFALVAIWNSWFNALIYLNSPNKFPITMVLRDISIKGTILGGALQQKVAMAAANGDPNRIPVNYQDAMMMVVVIPIIMIYPFLQKYFVKGMMLGSIKG